MNYTTFLKRVDGAAESCERDKLLAFIHELARTLSEEKRDRFLSVLESFTGATEKAVTVKDDDIDNDIDNIISKLEDMEDDERYLECEYNEMWDDWEDDEPEDEYVFSDPEDILDDIGEAVLLLHEAVDRQAYERGAALALTLSTLIVPVCGDYDECKMNVADLIRHRLIDTDTRTLLGESVYLSYMGNKEDERAEAMVRIMDNLDSYCITLEDILENSEEEIDVHSFLPSWIEALAKREGRAVDELLEEALGMLDDTETILGTASRYAQSHPVLYLTVMRDMDEPEMLDIGLKAMKEVPLESEERSEICLRTASYAFKAGKRKTMEMCWIEAFLSTASVTNFLRIRLLCENWLDNRDKVMQYARSFYNSKPIWRKTSYAAILFFDSDFDEMIRKFMNPGDGIGWSITFMKEGIALLLMLLSCGAQGKGMDAMRRTAFDALSFKGSEYSLGTDAKQTGSDYDMFIECFGTWKKSVTLSDSEAEDMISKIEGWTEIRVEAIMKANKRNYYGECASFIASLGEVEESRGKKGAKQSLMSAYRQLYSRRYAFANELVSYGMIK